MTNEPKEGDREEREVQNVTVNVNLPAALAKLDRDLQHLVDLISIGVTGVRKVEEAEYRISPFVSSQQLHEPLPYSDVKDEHLYWVLKNAFTEVIDRIGGFLEECRVLVTF